jgi:hypothetical protein
MSGEQAAQLLVRRTQPQMQDPPEVQAPRKIAGA